MAEVKDTLVLNADMNPQNLLPIMSLSWQDAVKAVYSGSAVVIHEYEDWDIRSPSITMKVPSVIMNATYSRPRRGVAWRSDNLWLRDRYTCQYCSQTFPASELTKDHVVPQFHGGKDGWDNIVAACHPCNSRKGHKRITPLRMPYKPSYYELIDIRKQYPLYVPHESWNMYLGWPDEKIVVRPKFNFAF